MKLLNFILQSFPLMIQQYADYYRETDLDTTLSQLSNDLSLPRIQTYDYIVVGGGSAGCIMAARLSEQCSVLLLEAGGSPVPATYVPYLVQAQEGVFYHPAVNNVFYSVKQKYFSLESGGIFRIPTGLMLGGSGSHNANIYNRGSPKDYDNFARLTQDDSWSYGNVLQYFKRMENYAGRLIKEEERPRYYSSGGPINVVTATNPPRLLSQWLNAGQELGYKVSDPNGHQEESFTPMAFSLLRGEKDNSYISYIKPIEPTRKSLTVLRYSQVEQILISANKTAYGVLYHRHGIPQIAHALREVIISGGTISTPLILIKSGIGPRTLLKKAQIPEVVHSPGVGRNLHDHCGTFLQFTMPDPNNTLQSIRDDNEETEFLEFQTRSASGDRRGLFATPLGMGEAFIVSSAAKKDGQPGWPDIQLLLQLPVHGEEGSTDGNAGNFIVQIVNNRQRSVGRVEFNVTAFTRGEVSDTQLAIVDHKFYSVKEDVDALVEAIKISLKVLETTEAFRGLNIKYVEATPGPCKRYTFRSDKYWRCYIRHKCKYWFHLAGTAKMGTNSDPMAVVDSKLRVRGVSRLRIVDASVLPTTTNSNLNSPTMMLAEKTADEMMREGSPESLLPPVPVPGWLGSILSKFPIG